MTHRRNVLIGLCLTLSVLAAVVAAQQTPPPTTAPNPRFSKGPSGGQAEPRPVEDPRVEGLLRRWVAEEQEEAKDAVENELRDVLRESFEERLAAHTREIEQLEETVRQLREQLQRRTEKQDEIIQFRLQQLLREAEGLGWGSSRGSGPHALPGGAAAPRAGRVDELRSAEQLARRSFERRPSTKAQAALSEVEERSPLGDLKQNLTEEVPLAIGNPVFEETGAGATLSLDYRFTDEGPQADARYTLMVSAAHGGRKVIDLEPGTLVREGTLQAPVPRFSAGDPVEIHLEVNRPSYYRPRRVSNVLETRAQETSARTRR